MATIRILSRCAGGDHLAVEVTSSLGVTQHQVKWGDVAAALTPEEILKLWWLNARMACKLAGATSFEAMKVVVEAREFKE